MQHLVGHRRLHLLRRPLPPGLQHQACVKHAFPCFLHERVQAPADSTDGTCTYLSFLSHDGGLTLHAVFALPAVDFLRATW